MLVIGDNPKLTSYPDPSPGKTMITAILHAETILIIQSCECTKGLG